MDSYLMMLYVTLEQESALKTFFIEQGWTFCKPDLAVLTDRLGPATTRLSMSIAEDEHNDQPQKEQSDKDSKTNMQASKVSTEHMTKQHVKRKSAHQEQNPVAPKQAKVETATCRVQDADASNKAIESSQPVEIKIEKDCLDTDSMGRIDDLKDEGIEDKDRAVSDVDGTNVLPRDNAAPVKRSSGTTKKRTKPKHQVLRKVIVKKEPIDDQASQYLGPTAELENVGRPQPGSTTGVPATELTSDTVDSTATTVSDTSINTMPSTSAETETGQSSGKGDVDETPSNPSQMSCKNGLCSASVQSVLFQVLKKVSSMERAMVGISKCIAEINAQINRVEAKVDDALSSRQFLSTSQSEAYVEQPQSVPTSEYLSDDLARTLFLESKGPGHFACKLLEIIFPELFGPDNSRLQYNWNGNCGKLELDTTRKAVLRRYVTFFYPETHALSTWSHMINRVNERLRRQVEKSKMELKKT